MNHSTELLHQAFAACIFCIAISLLLFGYRNYTRLLIISNAILNEDVMYEQYNDIDKEEFTRGEIVTLLFNQLEYDIEIDGFLISKVENTRENISSYPILDASFLKSYAYDSKGNITRIIFTNTIS
jgi:hypothetical protein